MKGCPMISPQTPWMKWMNANKPSIVEGGGYSVVHESHDPAAKIFGKDHPHLQIARRMDRNH